MESVAITPAKSTAKVSLVQKFAAKYSIEPGKLLGILKATAFKQDGDREVTDEQMAALMVVADQYGLNPFTKEIYAFADRGKGIVPVVGVDGWTRIANDHEQADGVDFRWSDATETMEAAQPCPTWCEVVIHRKDRAHPIVVREYLDECYRAPFKRQGSEPFKGPWQTHTKRMLRHKTLIQGYRLAFGFSGIYDEDEAQRIIEGQVIEGEAEKQGGVEGLKAKLPKPKKGDPTAQEVLASVVACCEKASAAKDAEIAHLALDDAADLARVLDGKEKTEAVAAIEAASKAVTDKFKTEV